MNLTAKEEVRRAAMEDLIRVGGFLRLRAEQLALGSISRLFVDDRGDIFALDSSSLAEVYRFDRTGAFVGVYGFDDGRRSKAPVLDFGVSGASLYLLSQFQLQRVDLERGHVTGILRVKVQVSVRLAIGRDLACVFSTLGGIACYDSDLRHEYTWRTSEERLLQRMTHLSVRPLAVVGNRRFAFGLV